MQENTFVLSSILQLQKKVKESFWAMFYRHIFIYTLIQLNRL